MFLTSIACLSHTSFSGNLESIVWASVSPKDNLRPGRWFGGCSAFVQARRTEFGSLVPCVVYLKLSARDQSQEDPRSLLAVQFS